MAEYLTLAEFKRHQGIDDIDTGDDTLIASYILAAQKVIDSHYQDQCAFGVEADTTRYFDVGGDTWGPELVFDRYLASITSITNGDGTTITSGQYKTMPRTDAPYYGVRLLRSQGGYWTFSDDPEGAIAVTGKWGYSTSVPDDVKMAMRRLVQFWYRQKDTGADVERPIIAGDGSIIMPQRLPRDVFDILQDRRLGIG